MKRMEVKTDHSKETMNISTKLARLLKAGDIITLEGELGAGKTVFAKGIAKGLHIKEPIMSPTFTIVKEYLGTFPLYHMDAYRLEFSEEDIGFAEYFEGEGITVVEWAQFIDDYIPENRLEIVIEYLSENERKILFTATGENYENVLEQLSIKM